jgi:predicted dienelactone hydrolase
MIRPVPPCPLAAALAGLVLAGCGAAVDPLDRAASLGAPGPFEVGFLTAEASYRHPIDGSERRLPLLVWYPAASGASGARPSYLLRSSEAAVVDAPPAPAEAPRPVVVFSHGHQAYAAAMSYLMEHLASHGYVALAPTHVGNTSFDAATRRTDIYYLRPLDISAALDALPALERRMGPVAQRALVVGHSFGGYTAYLAGGARHDLAWLGPACASQEGPREFCSGFTPQVAARLEDGFLDARVAGVVGVDPGDFALLGGDGVARVSVPVLHLTAAGSEPDPYPAALPASRTWLRLEGGAHNDFVDACGEGVLLRCSSLPARQVRDAVRTFVAAFAARVLAADDAVDILLTGELSISPVMKVQR